MGPASFGLPGKFTDWRKHQEDAMMWAAHAPERFVVLNMPVGSGKSLTYMGLSILADPDRVAVLTGTRGLQDQLLRDFSSMGLVDVRGQSNYHCKIEQDDGREWVTVDQGICHLGASCNLKARGCYYYDAVYRAGKSRLVLTNYSYWMTADAYTEGIGRFKTVIMDEAHIAPDELARFLGLRFSVDDLGLIGQGKPAETTWMEWARRGLPIMQSRFEALKGKVPRNGQRPPPSLFSDIRQYESVIKRLSTLAGANRNGWIMEDDGGEVCFDPIDVRPRAETLFQGADKIVFVSATVTPRTLMQFGITEAQIAYKDWPSTFDASRRPVIWVPTVRMWHGSSQQDLKNAIGRIDQIIQGRQDRRGIIHTVSYGRARQLMQHSRFSHLMVTHTKTTTRQTIEDFKAGRTPPILVSPVTSTGWDFPYQECEYQVVMKVPFADMRSKVMAARAKLDKTLSNLIAATELQQMVGRGMRAEDDQCETFVTDDNVQWLVNRNRQLFTGWFLESFRRSVVVPPPPPKLGGK